MAGVNSLVINDCHINETLFVLICLHDHIPFFV